MGDAGGAVTRATLCVAFLLLSVATLRTVSATTYSIHNNAPTTAGGRRYTAEMGDAYTFQMMGEVQKFIVDTLWPSFRTPDHIAFVIEDIGNPAQNAGNVITFDPDFLANAPQGQLRFEVKGLMFHEMCHSFQNSRGNYGGDAHFRGVIEGIATYMELVADYGVGPKAKGGEWYTGYHTTAHFFAWIDSTQRPRFVNLLNERMGQQDWNDDFFVSLTGKNVDTLWAEYQNSF